jgi:hypothetical protein
MKLPFEPLKPDEPREIRNDLGLRQSRVPLIGSLSVDLVTGELHEWSLPIHSEHRGAIRVKARLPSGEPDCVLKYELDESGLLDLFRVELPEAAFQTKTRPFDRYKLIGNEPEMHEHVSKLLRLHHAQRTVDVLREVGDLKEGDLASEKKLHRDLEQSVTNLFRDLRQYVRTHRSGLDLVRSLLSAKDEDEINLGLSLVQDSILAAVQDDLREIAKNTDTSLSVRKLAYALLFTEHQRALYRRWRDRSAKQDPLGGRVAARNRGSLGTSASRKPRAPAKAKRSKR